MTEPSAPILRRRSAPLPPDERRAALVAATAPLIRMHGLNVSTRLIAEAAGVAEGTIFRAFPDKNALLRAALAYIFDPTPTVQAIQDIPKTYPLQVRLAGAAGIVAHRMAVNAPVMAALRSPEGWELLGRESMAGSPRNAMQQIVDAVTVLISPDEAKLRRPAAVTAQLLVSMVMFSARGALGPDNLTGGDIADLLLNGLIDRSPTSPPTLDTGDHPC